MSVKEDLVKATNTKMEFEKSTMVLNEILKCQKFSHDKSRLGYDNNHKNVLNSKNYKSSTSKNQRGKWTYAKNIVKENSFAHQDSEQKNFKENTKGLTTSRFETIFHGHCYTCNKYGHKAIYCRNHGRNTQTITRGMFVVQVQCYNFHQFWHTAKKSVKQGFTQVWRRK